MAGVRPDDARQFYEEDEDPGRVFSIFDAAEKARTAPPSERPDLVPLRELLADLVRELRKLRLRDRVGRFLRRVVDAVESHSKVH